MLSLEFLYTLINKDTLFAFIAGCGCGLLLGKVFIKNDYRIIDSFCGLYPMQGYKKALKNGNLKRVICDKNIKGKCVISGGKCPY